MILFGLGSSQNLLDSTQLLSLQEDARSRKLTTEVMKSRLYDSVTSSPSRRRQLNSSRMAASMLAAEGDIYSDEVTQFYMHPSRMAMSVPVTPATSARTTPCHSPTSARRFLFGLFSRSQTMDQMTEEDDNTKGIGSIFSPQPKCIPAAAAQKPPLPPREDASASGEGQADGGEKFILSDPPPPKQRRSQSPTDMEL